MQNILFLAKKKNKWFWHLDTHYENMPIQVPGILKISRPKTENFQIKTLIFFLISAQNIDCGYSLELPRRGSSNETRFLK